MQPGILSRLPRLGLSVALAFATTGPAFAKTVTAAKSAPSGKAKLIDSFSGWNDDCSFLTIDLKVTKPPKNGAVTPKITMGKIGPAQSGKAGKCLGRPTRTLSVFYKSRPGYKGRDAFTVRMKVQGQSPVSFVYTLTVR